MAQQNKYLTQITKLFRRDQLNFKSLGKKEILVYKTRLGMRVHAFRSESVRKLIVMSANI